MHLCVVEFTHPYYQQLLQLEAYIRSHIDQDLSVGVLAQRMHLSTFHFHRIFKSLVGEPVHEYVTRIRLEVGALRLKFTEDKIQDIAFQVGYQNPETFSRAFVRSYQCTPRAFRKEQQQINESRLETIIRQRLVERAIPTQIKRLAPIRVAYWTHKGPYHTVEEAWDELLRHIPPQAIQQMIGIPYSDPQLVDAHHIRYDACVALRPGFTPTDLLQVKDIGGGKYVETIHQGPFETIDDTYQLLYGLWLPNSRYELRNEPVLEIYLTDSRVMAPAAHKTAIYLPIKSIST